MFIQFFLAGCNEFMTDNQKHNDVTDEFYLDNVFLARLCNLKFPDNSISRALKLNEAGRRYIREFEWQKTLGVFPRPVLKLLGLSVDKNFTTSSSTGDVMLYAVTGSPYVLGGFRTGSIFGSGYAMFGWFYPLVFGLLAVFIFIFADAQTSRKQISNQTGRANWQPILSPMAIITFFTWFFYLTSAATGCDSMSKLAQFMLRGWLQVLLIYAVAYWGTYAVLKPFGKAD